MISLAAEGGYQVFNLNGEDWFWLIFSAVTALLAIAVGFFLMRGVLAADQGTPKMIEIATAIQEGAMAYLKRQFKTIAVILIPLAIVVFVTSTEVVKPDGDRRSPGLTFAQSGIFRTLAFVAGCFLSGLTGFIGMSLAVRGNVRTAAAAKSGSLPGGAQGRVPHRRRRRHVHRRPRPARRHGHHHDLPEHRARRSSSASASVARCSRCSSASAAASSPRRPTSAPTSSARSRPGIPEDDPRNPATIADNVGDNVGDCAGMAADLFESYEVTLVASIILGVAAFQSIGAQPRARARSSRSPPAPSACSRRSSASSRCARPTRTSRRWRRSTAASSPPASSPSSAPRSSPSSTSATTRSTPAGSASAPSSPASCSPRSLSRLTEYFTSTETAPVREIAEATRTGPATDGALRHQLRPRVDASARSSPSPSRSASASALGGGNIQFTFYLVALTGMGMLATTGVVVSEDTFGPVADNAAGIAEMSGEFEGEPERIMVSLDAVGNTTKAVTKGFAIGSAVIAVGRAVRLLHRDDRRRARPAQGHHRQRAVQQLPHPDQRGRPEDLHRPADRWLGRVPLLGARHPRRRPHRRRRRAGGAQPVRRRRDHGRHQEARLRPGHRHLHRGVAA